MAVTNVMYYINRVDKASRRFVTLYGIDQFAELMASLDTFVELCEGGNIEFDLINDIIWYIDS